MSVVHRRYTRDRTRGAEWQSFGEGYIHSQADVSRLMCDLAGKLCNTDRDGAALR